MKKLFGIILILGSLTTHAYDSVSNKTGIDLKFAGQYDDQTTMIEISMPIIDANEDFIVLGTVGLANAQSGYYAYPWGIDNDRSDYATVGTEIRIPIDEFTSSGIEAAFRATYGIQIDSTEDFTGYEYDPVGGLNLGMGVRLVGSDYSDFGYSVGLEFSVNVEKSEEQVLLTVGFRL